MMTGTLVVQSSVRGSVSLLCVLVVLESLAYLPITEAWVYRNQDGRNSDNDEDSESSNNEDDLLDRDERGGGGFLLAPAYNSCQFQDSSGGGRSNGFISARPTVHLDPGTDLCFQDGVILQDDEWWGGQNVAYLDEGDILQYDLNLAQGGWYDMDVEVSSPDGWGSFRVYDMTLGSMDEVLAEQGWMPATGGWQNWETVTMGSWYELPAGSRTIQIQIRGGGFNMKSITFRKQQDTEEEESSSRTSPETEEEEEEEESENDSSNDNKSLSGPPYDTSGSNRNNAPPRNRFGGSGGSNNSLKFSSGGSSNRQDNSHQGSHNDQADRNPEDDTPQETPFAMFSPVERGGGFRLPEIEAECGSPLNRAPSGFVLTNIIQLSADSMCDSEGVFLQDNNNGGLSNVAWIDANDRMLFDVTLTWTGVYQVSLMVASPDGNGAVELRRLESETRFGVVDSFPATNDWQTFQPHETLMMLPEGSFTLELVAQDGGWNLQSIQLTPMPQAQVESQQDAPEEEPEPEQPQPTVLIAADDFSWTTAIQVEPSSEGVNNLAYISSNDLIDFTVRVPRSGRYRMEARLASLEGQGSFMVLDRTEETPHVLTTFNQVPSTGWWQTWESVTIADDVELSAGDNYPLQVLVQESGWNLQSISLFLEDDRRIRSYWYQLGNGVEGLDPFLLMASDYGAMQNIQMEGDVGKVQAVSWIDTGDWMDYDLFVPSSGRYNIRAHVASPEGSGEFKLLNRDTNEIFGTVGNFAATGDWGSWATTSRPEAITLPSGTFPLRIAVMSGGFNLQWLSLQLIESMDNDEVFPIGQMYNAADYAAMNGVQVEESSEGMRSLAWIDAMDWMKYTVNLPERGRYRLTLRVASPDGLGGLVVLGSMANSRRRTEKTEQNNKKNLRGLQIDSLSLELARIESIPVTGWWQTWESITTQLTLPAGSFHLTIQALESGWNLAWFSLELI